MDRRTALKVALGAGAASLSAACARAANEGITTRMSNTQTASAARMPAIFIAHGAPPLLDDARWMEELRQWGAALPRPKAILVISAHWLADPVTVGATTPVPLVYDFYGFPQRYYEVTYASPGAPELARRLRELVSTLGPVKDDPKRGLDHGAYIPLIPMFPSADVPVLQISVPTMDPKTLLALGRALAPLRDEGVLIAGSGFLTHNLGAADWGAKPKTPAWASELDAWAGAALASHDVDALLEYKNRAPGVRIALPTHEHFVPVLIALGASIGATGGASESVRFPIDGFAFGSFTKRSVQFG